MAWITENGFWILVFIAFFAMHLFGHGGHGSHGGHGGAARNKKGSDIDTGGAPGNPVNAGAGGHQH